MASGSGISVIARGAASPHGHGPVLPRMAMVLVLVQLLLGVIVNVVNAESVANIVSRSFFDSILNAPTLANCSCAIGQCCSIHGYCGTTSAYCGYGCQSGPCTSSGGGSPSTGGGNVGTIISQSVFDGLAGGAASSCEGKGFYTYDAFIAATKAYSRFGTSGGSEDQKRELAAFFAHVMHETGGLCYINEVNPGSIYCDSSSTWPCVTGKSYHGRGPLQLSWNFNYGAAGQDIGFDGLDNPEEVGLDATISFKTAMWFWMKNTDCHLVTIFAQGFGATIEVINSMECNGYFGWSYTRGFFDCANRWNSSPAGSILYTLVHLGDKVVPSNYL